MNKFNILGKDFSASLAFILVVAMLLWLTGFPVWMNNARAAALTSVKDTLSDSDLSVLSKHTIAFTTTNAVAAGQTIKIQLDPATSLFTQAFSAATTTDITVTGMTLVASCAGASDEVTVAGNYNGGSDENLTFTVCSGDSVAGGAKTVTVGAASTNLWTNPGVAASYVIRITTTATTADSGDTRVAIIDDVVVSATVDTNLTFTIAGVASGQAINGDATTTSSGATATALPFGTIAAGTAKTLGQTLTVTTNAKNGFSVTLQFDQALLSANGADIDFFKDGAGTATPVAWTTPLSTLDAELTYGHLGITSEDDLNTDEFGTALYAGNATTTARAVFSHTGPADGATANKGSTRIGYKVQIGTLQEAATDYTAAVTYVATPTF